MVPFVMLEQLDCPLLVASFATTAVAINGALKHALNPSPLLPYRQVSGLKSITAKHLALSCQCLGAFMALHPALAALFTQVCCTMVHACTGARQLSMAVSWRHAYSS